MMNYQIFNEPFPYIIIEDTFDAEQLKLIWRELEFLLDKLNDPEKYYAAKDESGEYLTTAKGMSLDTLYSQRSVSDILNITGDIFFNDDKFFDDLIQNNEYWVTYEKSDIDYTKVRRYYPGDGYEPHADYWVHALISTTLCYKEDSGGNLYFPKQDLEIETKNNRTIIFPGWIEHSVTDVIENERYAVTKFVCCSSGKK